MSSQNAALEWRRRLREQVIMKICKAKTGSKLIILFVCLILYMILCALIFSALERDIDKKSYEYFQTVKINYTRRYNMSDKEWTRLIIQASAMSKRGFLGEYKDYWNFYHSFWFTTTIVTTMGKKLLSMLFLVCNVNTEQ